MALDTGKIGSQIVGEAARIAAGDWKAISTHATIELRGLADRITRIIDLLAKGELTRAGAKRHLRKARFDVISTIAGLTVLLEATIEKIINGALKIVKDAVNQAAGFALLA